MTDTWRMKVADVRVTGGASDFRVYQQDGRGHADIEVGGVFDPLPGGRDLEVQIRLLKEADFSPVALSTGKAETAHAGRPVDKADTARAGRTAGRADTADWVRVDKMSRGSWGHVLRGVPAGGPYQIQTRLFWKDAAGLNEARLGDTVHHVGVGDLWLIAGQSNASGTGRGQAEDAPELGVHVLRNDETWGLAVHPLNEPRGTDHPNRGAGPGTSPYLRFGKILRRELGYPIGLIQTAKGGSALREWHVAEDPRAPLWHNMVHCVHLAGGRVRGMVWYQGCSDAGLAGDANSWDYEERWPRFVALARREFGDFPIVTTQINRSTDMKHPPDTQEGWTVMREVQRRLAAKVRGVCIVPALDIPLSDGIHNSSGGNVILGERIAQAALGFVYGRALVWRAPEARRARAERSRRAVTIEFDHVATELLFLGLGLRDFTVEDGAGRVEVTAAQAAGRTVRLELARPLEERAVVHGACGVDPEWTLRDLDTNLPALGFYGLKVET